MANRYVRPRTRNPSRRFKISYTPRIKWIIGEKHKLFGEVVAMGVRDGDPYRFFKGKNGVISLIPCDCLEELEKEEDSS